MSRARAFLSHSSKDKDFVRQVYEKIGPQFAEMDEFTFEGGLPSWEVITRALDRCGIFVLFASSNAFSAEWVQREITEARRRLKRGQLSRMFVFFVDDIDFRSAPEGIKDFAFFLRYNKVNPIVQAIFRHLNDIASFRSGEFDSFVGRDREVQTLKEILNNPSQPIACISVSGLPTIGRRHIIHRAMEDLHPHLNRAPFVIEFSSADSAVDLALDIQRLLSDSIHPSEVKQLNSRYAAYDVASAANALFASIKDVYKSDQYIIFSDAGGIIDQQGYYTPLFTELLKLFKQHRAYYLNLITQRRPIHRFRQSHPEIAFLDVQPMDSRQMTQYLVHHARRSKIEPIPTQIQINQIIELAAGHPMVADYIIGMIRTKGSTEQVLSFVEEVIDIKLDRGREILRSCNISDDATILLAVISNYGDVPDEFVPFLFEGDIRRALEAIAELTDLFLISKNDGIYSVTPPLRVAVSRDGRFTIRGNLEKDVLAAFVGAIESYRDEDNVPISIVGAGTMAAISSGTISALTNQLILPSQYVVLSSMMYNRRLYERSLDFAKSALANRGGLSEQPMVQAYRWQGLTRIIHRAFRSRPVEVLSDAVMGGAYGAVRTRVAA